MAPPWAPRGRPSVRHDNRRRGAFVALISVLAAASILLVRVSTHARAPSKGLAAQYGRGSQRACTKNVGRTPSARIRSPPNHQHNGLSIRHPRPAQPEIFRDLGASRRNTWVMMAAAAEEEEEEEPDNATSSSKTLTSETASSSSSSSSSSSTTNPPETDTDAKQDDAPAAGGVELPPSIVSALEDISDAIRKNPKQAATVAGFAGVAVTGAVALQNFMDAIPYPLLALEEAVGAAVCAYYVPQYVLSAEKRKGLQKSLAELWVKATGSESSLLQTRSDSSSSSSSMSDEELKKLSGGEVVAVIDDVLSRFEVELPGEVRTALVKAIQEIRLEDIKYREDYKVLVEEFELLALEKKELAEKIDSLETRLETLDNEYVNAKERVTDLQATLESAENERETALDRVKKDAEAARAQKEELEMQLQKTSSSAEQTETLQAQVKALKARLEEALDEVEGAQQITMDVEKEYKDKIENLKAELEIARLMEVSREEDTENLAAQLDSLVDEEAQAAAAAASGIDALVDSELLGVTAAQADEATEAAAATTTAAASPLSFVQASVEKVKATFNAADSETSTTAKTTKKEAAAEKQKPLSKMNKKELVEECQSLGLNTKGKVPELRVRIRTARKELKAN